jgi:lysine 2,3-aminomutase
MKVQEDKLRITQDDVQHMYERYHFPDDIQQIIEAENLLPHGILNRLEAAYPQHSGLKECAGFMFNDKVRYSGKRGFREIVAILQSHGIEIGHLTERELFIDVYRFMATRHVLNTINWSRFAKDSVFQLVFPQPGMINAETVKAYSEASSEEERAKIVAEYQTKTNPHDGKQKLNKPWFVNEEGEVEILQGSQHKYPPCQLIFDKTTQNCFAFCSYCFRHAQVRGDEDMFVQDDVNQIHQYLKQHPEVSDVLITGGDAGYISYDRLKTYMRPIIQDPALLHIKSLRLGSRALTFQPEMILHSDYTPTLELFREITENGVQVVWMGHFSTPREIINPSTIAAIRRLKHYGVTVKSQSPIMHHISLFSDETGKIDVDRSAQNWIDLGNILSMLGVGFHSMYCARPTGEHHYFTAPLAEINKVFSKVYRTLASINRPSRYITMTSSAGKISLLGTVEVNGETAFALKFNEGRNMEWLDKVYLAKYDEKENTIEKLKPFDTETYFYEKELVAIEKNLSDALDRELHHCEE